MLRSNTSGLMSDKPTINAQVLFRTRDYNTTIWCSDYNTTVWCSKRLYSQLYILQRQPVSCSEMRLETFKLGDSVSTWVPGGSDWTTHWGIRINDDLYELKVRKSPLRPCPATFGLAQNHRDRRVVTSTHIGWTFCDKDTLQLAGMSR